MLELADEKPSALLCMEREPAHCHRTLLLNAVRRMRRSSTCTPELAADEP